MTSIDFTSLMSLIKRGEIELTGDVWGGGEYFYADYKWLPDGKERFRFKIKGNRTPETDRFFFPTV
jgi:hypothetical protein